MSLIGPGVFDGSFYLGCHSVQLRLEYLVTRPDVSQVRLYTRGDQKVRGKVLLNRIAFNDCNENS